MPRFVYTITDKSTGKNQSFQIDYSYNGFPSNCGYSVISYISVKNNGVNLPHNSKVLKQILKQLKYDFITRYSSAKKILFSGLSGDSRHTKDFITVNKIMIGEKVPDNHGGGGHTILGEINPYSVKGGIKPPRFRTIEIKSRLVHNAW